MTANRWETHRGDEWWYTDYWCEATASAAGAVFQIESVSAKGGSLTQERLHQLLWLTREQFAAAQVQCALPASLRPLLEELARGRHIAWQLVSNPYSAEARLVEISAPAVQVKRDAQSLRHKGRGA